MRKPEADCPWCEGIGVIEFPGIRIDCQCCHPNVPTQALRDLYAQYKDRVGLDPLAQARAEGERAGIERAAKCADEFYDDNVRESYLEASSDIATAIRALKVEGE